MLTFFRRLRIKALESALRMLSKREAFALKHGDAGMAQKHRDQAKHYESRIAYLKQKVGTHA